jgi:membrane-associated protease RseP (regulator of RpoE activity)
MRLALALAALAALHAVPAAAQAPGAYYCDPLHIYNYPGAPNCPVRWRAVSPHGGLGIVTWQGISSEGASVEWVLPGGPADRAGVKPGDTITAVNGHPVTPFIDFRPIIAAAPIGSKLDLSIIRNGKEGKLEATIAPLSTADLSLIRKKTAALGMAMARKTWYVTTGTAFTVTPPGLHCALGDQGYLETGLARYPFSYLTPDEYYNGLMIHDESTVFARSFKDKEGHEKKLVFWVYTEGAMIPVAYWYDNLTYCENDTSGPGSWHG